MCIKSFCHCVLTDTSLNEGSQSQESEAETDVVKKTKFNMENAILQILSKAEDQEIKLKKLKKKVNVTQILIFINVIYNYIITTLTTPVLNP